MWRKPFRRPKRGLAGNFSGAIAPACLASVRPERKGADLLGCRSLSRIAKSGQDVPHHLSCGVDLQIDRDAAVRQIEDRPSEIRVAHFRMAIGEELIADEIPYLLPLAGEKLALPVSQGARRAAPGAASRGR